MSSWGNLRLALQIQYPGVPVDLLDSTLNSRYEQVLESGDWTGVKYHYTLETTAAYQSGQQGINPQPGEDSADLEVGSDIVNIINTPGQLPTVGMNFYVPGDTVTYTIESVADPSTAGAIVNLAPDNPGSGYVLDQILGIVQNGAQYGQAQVTAVGPGGSVLELAVYAGGQTYTTATGLATTVASGATITIVSETGGVITGIVIDAGTASPGTGPYIVGQILGIVQAGGSGGTAMVSAVDEEGIIIAVTLVTGGTGYSVAPNLSTTTSSGCTINVTQVSTISFTLDRNYEGNGVDPEGTGYLEYPYVYMQNVYELPADVRTVVSIIDPVTGFPLTPMTKDNLDFSAGPRTLVQNPQSYAVYDDTNELAPPVQHQIELYPPPLYGRGYVIEYLHAALGFDGSTTAASPMPWVSDTVLLYGCRADIGMYLAGQAATPAQAKVYIAQATGYERMFETELKRLLMIEHSQRRTKAPVKLAARFTRHRLARAARGWALTWRGGVPGGPT